MITRSKLAEQLREYQIRSKHDWASVSFFSSTSNLTSTRYPVACSIVLLFDDIVGVDILCCIWHCQVYYRLELRSSGNDLSTRLLGSGMDCVHSNLPDLTTWEYTGRVDVVIFVIWELVILAFLVLSAVSLYFRHLKLAFILVCVTLLLVLSMKIAKKVRSARKKKRRMLLPLSM